MVNDFFIWESLLHVAGSFPALGILAAHCRRFSSLGNRCCTLQEAFQLWESSLHVAGSFPALGIVAARCRRFSSFRYCFFSNAGKPSVPSAYRQLVSERALFMAFMAVSHVVEPSTFVASPALVISLPMPLSPVTVPFQ